MVSCRAVWTVLLLAGAVALCNASDSLFPVNIGLEDEDPLLPNERNSVDDCHLRYLRYGREEVEPSDERPPHAEPREHQHIAAIGWTRSGGTIDWPCMGTLIWDRFVLTSARCTVIGDRNTAPDVVRLGDHPGANPEYVQQRNIVHVVSHPEFEPQTGRHDLALLQLDKRIIVNQTVAPACLWLAPETIFSKLESVRRTEVASVPAVSSVPVVQTNGGAECPTAASSPLDPQLCVAPVDVDTPTACPDGSAGSPLQVRLLHNFKTSPFVVGIVTSDRTATDTARSTAASCRGARVQVYTRIGSYADWIVRAMQERNVTVTPDDFIPAVCALRFAHTRPRADELLAERHGELPRFDVQVEWKAADFFPYVAQIAWPAASQAPRNDCVGTFVDQRTLLTLAECVAPSGPDGLQPTAVLRATRYSNSSFPIASITVHPGYVRGSQRNNIAVVKLAAQEELDRVVPACIWSYPSLEYPRVDLAGVGYSSLNSFPGDEIIQLDKQPFLAYQLHAVDSYPWANCSTELAKAANRSLSGLSSADHVCYRNEQWTVPGVCRQLPGGPVQRYIARAGAFLKYVHALSLTGGSCGYGQPSVAILLEPHIDWLRTVLVGARPNASGAPPSESLIVINPDLKRSDECSNGDGTIGICVPHEMCLSTPERLRQGARVTVCSVGSVVCCPWGDIARNGAAANPARVELAGCEVRYRTFREQRWDAQQADNGTELTNLPHVAEIGWRQNNARIQFHCTGYLVNTNTIVTSARCAESQLWKPTVARIGALNAGDDTANHLLQPIRRVTLHEAYDDVTGVNDIALIQLTEHIQPTRFYFPGCLYSNATHVPVRQTIVSFGRGNDLEFGKIFPMYGSDCRERAGQSIGTGQMCYRRQKPEAQRIVSRRCYTTGDVLLWDRLTEEEIVDQQYLVGLFSHGRCDEIDDIQVVTRMSAYYDWVADNIK